MVKDEMVRRGGERWNGGEMWEWLRGLRECYCVLLDGEG